jgi:hypothetical protein
MNAGSPDQAVWVYKRLGFRFPLTHHAKVKTLYRPSALVKMTEHKTANLFS